jgi:hypothetical protein
MLQLRQVVRVEPPRIFLVDVRVTTRIAQFEEFRIGKFPIDRPARPNADPDRLWMKI